MTTKVKWIIGTILLIIIGFTVLKSTFLDKLKIKISSYHEKTFKKFDIKSTNMIANRTKDNYLDSIIYVGLNELGIDSIAVTIRPITEEAKKQFDSDGTLEAYIIGKNRQYIIFLDDMSRDKAITVLSHEMIHLQQYSTRRLIVQEYGVIWDGRSYFGYELFDLKYENRPWEIEAFADQRPLEFKIRKILY